MTLHTFYTLITGVIGACWGSFLNAAFYREAIDMSLAKPASHCPDCKQPIPPYFNIPVFGWALTKGKCFSCQRPISIHYPLIELLVAGLFIACLAITQTPLPACLFGALISLYAMGAVFDHKYFLLPNVTLDVTVLLAIAIAFTASGIVYPNLAQDWPGVVQHSSIRGLEVMLSGGAVLVFLLLAVKYTGELFVRRTEEFGGQMFIDKNGVRSIYPNGEEHVTLWENFVYTKVIPRGCVSVYSAPGMQEDQAPMIFLDGDVVIYDGSVRFKNVEVDLDKGIELRAEELYICRNAMGLGDIRLAASLGTILGLNYGLAEMFFLACCTGSLHGAYLRRKDRRLPFGPHLMIATAYVVISRHALVPQVRSLLALLHNAFR
jgi:leader peptidase (prepilin peptidase) / N-methyltransferase